MEQRKTISLLDFKNTACPRENKEIFKVGSPRKLTNQIKVELLMESARLAKIAFEELLVELDGRQTAFARWTMNDLEKTIKRCL